MGTQARIAVAGLVVTILLEFALFESARRWRWNSWNSQTAPHAELRVDTWGSGLRISWSPDSPPIRSSRTAALLIADGEFPVEYLSLDAVQLTSGEFFYSPKTRVVRFRLDVGRPPQSVGSAIAVLGDRPWMAMR
jgi:hypothetical protein